ncbi:aldehyde dehydrogenase family protein [Streptomyces caelestis]|uniref:aldehyde dehydrogenase family protein n=1 Tax=Streptomyces caelestis TaxID=36816 RepID=UPI0036FD5775
MRSCSRGHTTLRVVGEEATGDGFQDCRPLRGLHQVDYAAAYFRWYAEEAVGQHARSTPSPDGKSHIVTVAEPVGPCLLITPRNVPPDMAGPQDRRSPGRRRHRRPQTGRAHHAVIPRTGRAGA